MVVLIEIALKKSLPGMMEPNRNRFKEKPSWYDGTNYDALVREMEENKPSTLSETYFIGTPTIYEIVDHKVSQVYIGSNEINGVLNSQ